jgi:hypothetical protein
MTVSGSAIIKWNATTFSVVADWQKYNLIKGIKMSKMSDLSIEIDNMLEAGYLPVTIARQLEIPITWVYETVDSQLELGEDITEELSPFRTVNS